jgi:hypothetical protein
MKDACRYIESGVVGRLAFKRNDRENHDVELEDDKTFVGASLNTFLFSHLYTFN